MHTGNKKNLFIESILETFPSMRKNLNIQVSKAYRIPINSDEKWSSQWHIIVRSADVQLKEFWKMSEKRKIIMYKSQPIRIPTDFPIQTLKARKAWNEVFQVLKVNDFQPRLIYLVKQSFKTDGEIRTFHEKRTS